MPCQSMRSRCSRRGLLSRYMKFIWGSKFVHSFYGVISRESWNFILVLPVQAYALSLSVTFFFVGQAGRALS